MSKNLSSLDPVVLESITLQVAKIESKMLSKYPLHIGFVAQGDLIYKGLREVVDFLTESEKDVVLQSLHVLVEFGTATF